MSLLNNNDIYHLYESVILNEANIINPNKVSNFTRSILGNYIINSGFHHTDVPSEIFKWVDTKLAKYFIQHSHMLPLVDYNPTDSDPQWMKGKTDLVQINPSLNNGGLIDEFRRSYNQIYQDIMHIFDWMATLNGHDLKKLDRITYDQALEHANKWVEEINKRAKGEEDWSNVIPVMEWPDGFKMVLIKGDVCLEREGKLMGHCVGGGGYDSKHNKIYSLRDPNNKPHVTIQAVREDALPSSKFVIVQIKGKENKAPIEKYHSYIKEFIAREGLDIIDDGRNIGLIRWNKVWYDPDSEKWQEVYNQEIVPRQEKTIQDVLNRIKNGVIGDNVDLSELYLKELPDLSNIKVVGNFYCSNNQLQTLKGSPREVVGNFSCSNNQLQTLKGSPREVVGNFSCAHSQLRTLEGAPKKVGNDFNCAYNQLTSLKGAPREVNGWFFCNSNPLTSLKGAPLYIGKQLYSDQFNSNDYRKYISSMKTESFKSFYESFQGRDSQYARTGRGPTVAGADGMKPPTQSIKTQALGDSRFTGFNDIPVYFPPNDDEGESDNILNIPQFHISDVDEDEYFEWIESIEADNIIPSDFTEGINHREVAPLIYRQGKPIFNLTIEGIDPSVDGLTAYYVIDNPSILKQISNIVLNSGDEYIELAQDINEGKIKEFGLHLHLDGFAGESTGDFEVIFFEGQNSINQMLRWWQSHVG